MKSLRHLIPYYRPYRAKVAAGLALVIVSSASATLVPMAPAAGARFDGSRTAGNRRLTRFPPWTRTPKRDGRYWSLLRRQQLVEAIEAADSALRVAG